MQDFVTYLRETLNLGQHSDWIIQITVVIFLSQLASFFANRILKKLHTKLEKTANFWDDALIDAARRPVRTTIWIVGIGFAADIIYRATGAPIFSGAGPIRDVGVIAAMAWFLLRFIKSGERNFRHRVEEQGKEFDVTTANAVSNILRATVIIAAVLVSLQTLGFSIEGVLAFGGIGGIAVGFAAKDLLANFFGALMIYFDRPFQVGDWIRSPDKQIEGTVEDIGWRLTIIRTFDKRPLYVPNSVFTQIAVENPSRMTHRRIYETIGIRYADIDKMQAITEAVTTMLKAHEEIDESQTMIVNFNAFNASSVDFFVYTFTHTTQWVRFHEIKQDVLLKISEIIGEHGAEIAFPTRTLHVAEVLNIEQTTGSESKAA